MLKENFPAFGRKCLCAICDVFPRLGLELSWGSLRACSEFGWDQDVVLPRTPQL